MRVYRQDGSWPCGSAAISAVSSTMALSGSARHRKGTTVRPRTGICRTSSAIRPVSGIRFGTPSPGSRVPSGSTSTTTSRPGRTTAPGISALTELESASSPTSVGMGVAPAGMLATCRSAPPTKNRARTAGSPSVVGTAAVTKTRSSASSPATSGTGYLRDCTAWVRYASAPPPPEHNAIRRLWIFSIQSRKRGPGGTQRSVSPAWSVSRASRSVSAAGSGPDSPALPLRPRPISLVKPPNSGGTGPVSPLWSRCSQYSVVRSPRSLGIGPERSLSCRCSDRKFLRLPSCRGIGPERSLSPRINRRRSAGLPSSRGIGPESRFSPSRIPRMLERFPSSEGIGPERSLRCRDSHLRLARSPSSGGIEPERPCPPRFRSSSSARLPSSGGIGPVNESRLENAHLQRPSTFRLARFPSSGGMVPERELSARISVWRLARPPISGGMGPVRLFSRSSRPVTLSCPSTLTPCHLRSGASVIQ